MCVLCAVIVRASLCQTACRKSVVHLVLQLAAEYLSQHAGELENKVYDVPAAIDDGVARVKLETLGVKTDTLTEEQIAYMNSWYF